MQQRITLGESDPKFIGGIADAVSYALGSGIGWLLALVDWISPEYENNKEVVQHKLYEFMRRMEQHKDK